MAEQLTQITPRRSPLIPRSIDNTALDAFMTCPRKYYYSMEAGRRKKGSLSVALSFGTTWHAILEAHYKTGGDKVAVTKAGIMSWEPHGNPDDHRTLERALSSYDQYLAEWGDFETEQRGWGKTVGWPDSPVVEQATDLWWEGALHPYAGKIDRVIEYQGLYYVEDHKTTAALGDRYFQQWDPSNQMMGYAVLAQHLTGLPIAGVRINAFGVLKTQSKFKRQTILYSQPRLMDWQENYNKWVRRLEHSYEELRNAYIAEDVKEAALNSAFPHNFNACAGKYGPCAYVEVCTQAPHMRERVLDFEYDHNPWDPMAAAEEGEL